MKLIDFGVAGLLSGSADDNSAPMTLAYAAPEQISGKEVTIRTDVFGIGMTLHELLTGTIPARKGLAVEVSPSLTDPELNAVLNKALSAKPSARYASAETLHLDIERYLTDFPVNAAEPTQTYVFSKFVKRNRASVALTSALIAALTVGIIGTTKMTLAANKAAAERELARQIAEDRAAFATINSSTFASLTGQAIAASETGTADFRALIAKETDDAAARLDTEPVRSRAKLHAISKIHDRRGDVDAVLKTVTPVFNAADIDSRANVMNLIIFGVYTGWQGGKDEAFEAFERARVIMNKKPDFYRFDLAMVDAFTAEFSVDPAQTQAAINTLIATGNATSLTSDSARNEAVTLFRQAGYLYNRQNKPADALPLIRRAYEINLTIEGARDLPNEALLYPLVSIYAAMGDDAAALEMSDAVVKDAEKTYGPSVPLAQRIKRQADLRQRLGQKDTVMADYERAADLFSTYDAKPSEQYMEVRMDMALLKARSGDAATALSDTDDIFNENAEYIEGNTNTAVLLYRQRGDIMAALGRSDDARASYEKSLRLGQSPAARPDRVAAAKAALKQLDAPTAQQ